MFDWLHNTRQRQSEWMDEDSVSPAELLRALKFIRRVNSWLGYTRSIIHHFNRFSQNWKPNERITILDLATGSADIPRAILKWARQNNLNIHIVAIDRHPITIRTALSPSPGTPGEGRGGGQSEPNLQILQADVFNLPFEDQSFDYVMTAMFLHHLDESQIVQVLKTMDRLARRGILAADLLRHCRAYFWINLLTLFSTKMIRHDATVSIAQALSKQEVLQIRDQANIPYATYYQHFAHRFILAGEKGSSTVE